MWSTMHSSFGRVVLDRGKLLKTRMLDLHSDLYSRSPVYSRVYLGQTGNSNGFGVKFREDRFYVYAVILVEKLLNVFQARLFAGIKTWSKGFLPLNRQHDR